MTKIGEIMTAVPTVASPDMTLREAAEEMDRLDVGVLPVVEDGRLVGMITDRDITVRATSAGKPPEETRVSEATSGGARSCREADDIAVAEGMMAELQVRRLPVVDENGKLIGIVSLGDLATTHEKGVEDTLDMVSRPAGPDRPDADE